MRRHVRGPAAALCITAAGLSMLAAGCGGSDSGSAAAPAPSTAATAPPATTAPATTPAAPVGPGNVAAGKVVFQQNCDTCHAGLGTRKYIGPKLKGQALTAAFIRMRVIDGKSPMPAGLVSGQDLADVVAFVHSIQ